MRIPILVLPLASLLFASGCYSRARVTFRPQVPSQVVVASNPPPVREAVVTRPAAPSADAAWVDGYWKWEGGEWVWDGGHWERGHSGQAWVAPVADEDNGRVVYRPGYWRAEDEPPAPAYQSRGTVRVSVRPATPSSPPPATARVSARTSGGDGSVTVRERPAPPPNANNADPSVAVAVRPAPTTGTAVTPGTTVTPRTNVPTQTPRTVVAGPNGANVATTTPRTVVAPNQGANVTTTTPRTVVAPNQGANASATVPQTRVGSATVTNPNSGTTQRIALACSISTERAPLNGLISVRGTFGANARVQIGGTFAPIVNRRTREMRVRVPGNSGGGIVRVLQGNEVANCGTLSVGR